VRCSCPVVDHEAATPVYIQVANELRQQIQKGKLPPGRRVPSESDLEQLYGVARGTARKAIAVLRDEGLIETVRGKGSFVVTGP
jgi:DNA-binding GntR family transcriptional regulator